MAKLLVRLRGAHRAQIIAGVEDDYLFGLREGPPDFAIVTLLGVGTGNAKNLVERVGEGEEHPWKHHWEMNLASMTPADLAKFNAGTLVVGPPDQGGDLSLGQFKKVLHHKRDDHDGGGVDL